MQVNRVQSNNNQPNFKALKFTEGTKSLLKTLSGEELLQIKQLQKEVANTKHWDFEVKGHATRDYFWGEFINKDKSYYGAVLDGNLHPWKREDNIVTMKSYDCEDDYYDKFRFPSAGRAEQVQSTLVNAERLSNPFEQIKQFVKTLKVLEESTAFMLVENASKVASKAGIDVVSTKVAENIQPEKLLFTQRLKNAWQALKGN